MFFDEKPSLPVGSFAKGDPSSLEDVWNVSLDAQRKLNNDSALVRNLEEEIDKRNDEIRKAGGPELPNPMRQVLDRADIDDLMKTTSGVELQDLPGFSAIQAGSNRDYIRYYYLKKYDERLKEIATKTPDLMGVVRPDETPSMMVAKRGRAIKEQQSDVFARRGWDNDTPLLGSVIDSAQDPLGAATMLGAGLYGQLESPVDMLANLVGFAGRPQQSLIKLALQNAAANALVQTGLEPGIAAQQRQMGINYTLAESLESIGGAGVMGGALDFSIRAPGRAIISTFGRNTPAETLFSRNTQRGGLFTAAPEPQAVPGTIVDLPPLPNLDQEAVTRAANGDMAAMRSIYESVTGQKVEVPPELAELAAKARQGDMAAVRKLADDVGLTEDPAVKGAFDRLEIEGTDDAIANLRRELQARDVGVDIDDGAVQRRVLQALKSQIDPDEPMPMGGLEVTQRNRIPDLSDEAELPAGTTGTNQHSRTLDFDGRPAQVRELDLKAAENSTAIRGLERQIDRLQSQVWDQERAGRVVAFEPKDGALKIVDGQARADLAKRIEGDTKAEGVVFREADGWTLREVEGIALYKNLRESKTSLMQTATLMRDYRELLDGTLPMESDFDITAANLSRLSDGAWGMLQRGEVSQDMAAMVAEYVPEANHAGIIQDLARAGITDVNEARRALPDLLPPTGMAEANAILLGLPDDPAMRDMPLRAGADVDDPKGPAAKAQIERLSTELAPEIAEAQALAQVVSGLDERIMDIRQEMRDPNISPEDAAGKRLELRQTENDRAVAAGDMTSAERVVTEAMQRQADVDAAIADVIGMVPKGVEVRTFSAVTDLPASIMAEVMQGNAAAFRQALTGLHRAATPEARARAMAELERAKEGRAIEGLAQNNVIYVATYALDPQAIVAHETVHALRNMGQITDAELSLLAGRAKRDGVFNEDLYRQALAGRQNLDALLKEEAAAHLIQARKEGKSFGAKTDGIIDRLRTMLEAMGNALRGYGFRTADEVVDAILSGEMARRDVTRAAMRAEDVTAMSIRSSLDMSPEARKDDSSNLMFAFAGENARTADLDALRRAKEMEGTGKDRTAIWNDTGWFRGVDGKWRFEIDDSGAMIPFTTQDRVTNNGVDSGGALFAAIKHPALLDAYPDLRRHSWTMRRSDVIAGSYERNSGESFNTGNIEVQGPTTTDRLSVLLHEAQHGVQANERFAQGAGGNTFVQQADAELAAKALSWRREMDRHEGDLSARDNAAAEEYAALGAPDWVPSADARNVAMDMGGNPTSVLEEIVKLYGLDRRTSAYSPREMYKRTAGEVEARAVQKRIDLTPDQRRSRPPWEDYDVPEDQQIVRGQGQEPMFSIRQDAEPEPSPKAMVKSTVRAYADALSELQARANELGVDPDDLARLTEQNPETAPIAQRMEAARIQLAEAIGDDQARALTDIMVSAAPLMRNVDPTAVANMVDGLLDQLLPDPPPARPANDNALPTPLQRDMMDLQRIEEAGTLVSVCRL